MIVPIEVPTDTAPVSSPASTSRALTPMRRAAVPPPPGAQGELPAAVPGPIPAPVDGCSFLGLDWRAWLLILAALVALYWWLQQKKRRAPASTPPVWEWEEE